METYQHGSEIKPYCISFSINDGVASIYCDKTENIFIKFMKKVISEVDEKSITFYIHNINFDGFIIMGCVFEHGFKFDWVVKGTNIYKLRVFYLDMVFIFKCSFKFIPISLSSASENLTFKKSIFPYKFVRNDNLNYIGVWPKIEYFNDDVSLNSYNKLLALDPIFDLKKKTIEYCENDVKLTKELMEKLVESLGKENLFLFKKSLSSPSLSYKIFFKNFNKGNVKEKIKKEEELYVRKSYYGGRCEVFGNPKNSEKVFYFDFSGMYMQCMKQKFPIGKGYFKIKNTKYTEIGFHKIRFISSEYIPVLPTRNAENKLMFMNGKQEGCYWYEEIILFVEYGGIVLEVLSSYVYEQEIEVFKEYVEKFEDLRKKNGFFKIFGKLMINSLYGGFGMSEKNYESFISFSKNETEHLIESTDVVEYTTKNQCTILKILKNKKSDIILNKKENKWSNTMSTRNVVYASIIASKARLKLYRTLAEVEKSEGRVLYCDTDSVAAAYEKNMLGEVVGEAKWSEEWKNSCFIAPKFYAYEMGEKEYVRIKGISKNQYSIKKIKEAFYGNDKFIKYANQLNFRKKNYSLTQHYIIKIIFVNKYNKRIFSKDKKNTSPIRV